MSDKPTHPSKIDWDSNLIVIPRAQYEAYVMAAKDIDWMMTFIDRDENWQRIRDTHAALRVAGCLEDGE